MKAREKHGVHNIDVDGKTTKSTFVSSYDVPNANGMLHFWNMHSKT